MKSLLNDDIIDWGYAAHCARRRTQTLLMGGQVRMSTSFVSFHLTRGYHCGILNMLSGSRCWPMSSAPSINPISVPRSSLRGPIPLLSEEGPGVVGRRTPEVGRRVSRPISLGRGLPANCARGRHKARPSRRVMDCVKNTKIVGTNSPTLLKLPT